MKIADLSVKDLMQGNPRTISGDAVLREAARIMRDEKVSSLVVEPENERDAFGILTRKDIVEALVSLEKTGVLLLVRDVMTRPAITVSPELSIDHCLHLMRMVGVRRLPVVNGRHLVGILSNTDVFRHLVRNIDSEP